MVTLSDELVNVLLEMGWHDAQCKQFRPFLMDSKWYMLGRALARASQEDFLYEDFN